VPTTTDELDVRQRRNRFATGCDRGTVAGTCDTMACIEKPATGLGADGPERVVLAHLRAWVTTGAWGLALILQCRRLTQLYDAYLQRMAQIKHLDGMYRFWEKTRTQQDIY
jgi:hypothetical protein